MAARAPSTATCGRTGRPPTQSSSSCSARSSAAAPPVWRGLETPRAVPWCWPSLIARSSRARRTRDSPYPLHQRDQRRGAPPWRPDGRPLLPAVGYPLIGLEPRARWRTPRGTTSRGTVRMSGPAASSRMPTVRGRSCTADVDHRTPGLSTDTVRRRRPRDHDWLLSSPCCWPTRPSSSRQSQGGPLPRRHGSPSFLQVLRPAPSRAPRGRLSVALGHHRGQAPCSPPRC